MLLKQLLSDISAEKITGEKNIDICGVSSHSAEIKKDYLFIALKGNLRDGHNFISDAINRGASAIVVDRNFKFNAGGVTCIYVDDVQYTLSKIADNFYGNPTSEIKIVGITGTNGKTTVSYLVENIMKTSGLATGRIGTIDYCWGERIIPSSHTTPPPIFLHELFGKMKADGIKAVSMEVSSHALAQKRVDCIQFDSCIFTNIERDHLDYHPTVSDYISSKSRLINLLHSSKKPKKFLVINGDDKVLKNFPSFDLPRIFYGLDRANDVYASDINFNWEKTVFNLNSPWYKGKVEAQLVGNFNIYNILAAISFAGMGGLDMEAVLECLKNIKQITGRFHVFKKDGKIAIVDYAHTPDALKKVIETAKTLTKGKLITVFGCGGDRDKGKRQMMGEVASQNSDYTIITSDNPRSEDPMDIVEDIKKGLSGNNNWNMETDRARAIKQGIEMLNKGDVLLVAGKGHENYQILKDTVIHFNDIEIIREYFE